MSIFRSIFGKTDAPQQAPSSNDTPKVEVQHSRPQERRVRQRLNARSDTRILIIDDSPTIVAALSKILISSGYATFQAFDAESGIEVARQEKPELIFLDIVLPGMNGFAALRQMRRDSLTRHIPIIMISGNEQATEQFYANRIGADDFMKKPFSRSEVFAKIEPLLDEDLTPRRRNFAANEMPPAANHAAPAFTTAIEQSTPPVPARETSETLEITSSPASAPLTSTPMTAATAVPLVSPPSPPASTASRLPSSFSALEARKELTAMGLQYFDQNQFVAAIQRGDKLAFELFVAGSGIDLVAESDGKTPLQVARENGRTQIFALLRARITATQT